MRLEELTSDDKVTIRAIIELTLDIGIIHQTLQSNGFSINLKSLTHNQIKVLINDLVDFDSDFDGGNLDRDLDELDLDLGWDL